MLSFALFDTKQDERDMLEHMVKDNVAMLSDEDLKLSASGSPDDFRDVIESGGICDMGCLDITPNDGICLAEDFRRAHDNAMLMLIADGSISPLKYIKPTIMAAGLMLRPLSRDVASENLNEFMREYMDSHGSGTDSEFVIETRDDIVRIPFAKIIYVEAKDKKVFIRVADEEYGYYDTLDNLEKELPPNFIRCHRGYIVNKNKIRRLINTENLLELDGEICIPVSRSLKKNIKDCIK